jgi:hypothetical protein
MLDPHITDLSSESPDETDLRRYKTTNRRIYDQAFARARKPPSVVRLLIYSEFNTSPRNPFTDKFIIIGNDNVKYRNPDTGRRMGNTNFISRDTIFEWGDEAVFA